LSRYPSETGSESGEVEKAISNNNVERAGCRLSLTKTGEGKPLIVMELFHETVQHFGGITLAFEVPSGITLEQTRDLAAEEKLPWKCNQL
jgi:hypothetical protein